MQPSAGVAVGHANGVVRAGLAHVLDGAGLGVVAAGDVAATVEAAAQPDIGVVVCDASLPGGGALEVLRAVSASERPVPVVVMVSPTAPDEIPWGFFAAAVLGTDDGTQLLAALAAVAAGGTYLDPAVRQACADDTEPVLARLTARELQILKAIADGQSTREIAESLILSAETVKTHVGNLTRKLGVDSRSGAIAMAFRLGLIRVEDDGPASYRLVTQGHYPNRAGSATCVDPSTVAAQVLRHLYRRVGFALWMVTKTDCDDWIVLQSLDRFYGVQAGSIFRWSDSFCSRMVRDDGPRIAPTSNDVPAYTEAPIGKQLTISAYVGVPIVRHDGSLFGTLCAIDPAPQPPAITAELATVERLAYLLGRVL